MQTMTDQELLKIVTPMVEQMQQSWDQDNRELFVSNLSDEFVKFMTKEEFDKQRTKYFSQQGAHTSIKCLLAHRNPDNFVVIWEMTCTGRSIPVLLICKFSEQEKTLVIDGANVIT